MNAMHVEFWYRSYETHIVVTSTPESPLTEGSVAAVIHFASPSIPVACPVHLILDHHKNIL